MGTEFLETLVSQAEDICHCIREARRIFGYRHYDAELECKVLLTITCFSRFSAG